MLREKSFLRGGSFFVIVSVFFALFLGPHQVLAEDVVDALLSKVGQELNVAGPASAKLELEKLASLEASMTPKQRGTYFKLLASSYAYRGMYREQVDISKKALGQIREPDLRASLLYYLADGYSSLGEYENSLEAMNDSILLLPKLTELDAKMAVLQSAYSLLESLHAYDEAASYAERLTSLPDSGSMTSTCVGLADLVEISFLQHKSEHARALIPVEVAACEKGGHKNIELSVRALDLSDRLSSHVSKEILDESNELLSDLTMVSGQSDYTIQLAEAMANRYLQDGQLSKAEQFATRAVEWTNNSSAILLRQQANLTMASILRAEGKVDQALSYFDMSNKLWAKLLEERSHKDLAYQRMKFKSQDQSNQLSLLSQINELLTKERELQERNKHILEFLVLVIALLLAFVSVSLMRIWRQKNDLKAFSQIDGLTKISNRGHFIVCAHNAFKDARGSLSIVVFDMDEFKLINDTFGHAAGDWVLKIVSSTIASCLRAQDMFGRLGGEEFAICLPRTSEQEAMALAERCRAAIEAIDSSASGHKFTLSASFGIAVRPPGGAAGFEEVLAAADRVLYQAKHMGRNRIVPYGEVFNHAPLVA